MTSVSCYREIYERAPIDRSTRSIRLLSHQGLGRGFLLQSFQLISAPPYTAVSYTWGDPYPPPEPHNITVSPQSAKSSKLSSTIKINGRNFKVTQNLRAFLDQVPFNTSSNRVISYQWYWIDALCINQGDNEERTHQVGMMGDIYSSAALVHIWLGPGTYGSYNAIEYMEKVVAWGGSVIYVPDNVEICLKSLFHRTYWGRIWIFQEVLLAKTIEVSCGNKTMGWETLDRFHDMLIRAQHEKILKGSAKSIFGSNALRLIRNKSLIQQLKPTNMAVALAYLIEATTPMEATDQRDKVYALLGLSEQLGPHCKASRLQADYEKTLPTIVTDVLCYLTEGEVFQLPVLRSTDSTDSLRTAFRFGNQSADTIACRPQARQLHFNKFRVTRQLKESLGISADDAYAAARASGTMTDAELEQLLAVMDAVPTANQELEFDPVDGFYMLGDTKRIP